MKFLFIHINKCGGTSVKKVLTKYKHVYIPQNKSLVKLNKGPKWNQYTKFTIVRNPYSRVLSLYGMLNNNKEKYTLDDIIKIITDDTIGYTDSGSKSKKYIKRHGLKLTHPHYSIYDNGKIIVDHVYKLEEIDKKWHEIKKMLSIKENLPQLNKTKSYSEKDFNIFNRKQLDLINNYFIEDFTVFEYKMI